LDHTDTLIHAHSLVGDVVKVGGNYGFNVEAFGHAAAYMMIFTEYEEVDIARNQVIARLALRIKGWGDGEAAYWIEQAYRRSDRHDSMRDTPGEMVAKAITTRKTVESAAEYALHMAAG
jgi:hypothetical protein